jgi:hypothetical protein
LTKEKEEHLTLEEDYLELEKDFDEACLTNKTQASDIQRFRLQVRDLEAECYSIKEYAADCLKKYEKFS